MATPRELGNLGDAAGSTAPTTNVNIDVGTLFIDGTNNRVGIANSAPSATLTVTGNVVVSGTVSDRGSDVRSIPQNARTSAYTLAANDAGRHISITTGGVTVPASVFSIGDAISIYNNSTSGQTITQASGVTLRLAGTATTGNRTIAQYGLCTVLCVASNAFVISGVGIS
jgi:hypothetical protein